MSTDLATLRLKKGEERRLRAGHLWLFSNEVDVAATPLKNFQPGEQVAIEDHRGKFIGLGYVNPNSLICARLINRAANQPLDKSLIIHRLNAALSLREMLFSKPYYRLIYGESDLLPGLVVDRFGDTVVVQITTAGMEAQREAVIAAVDKTLRPRTLILRNDSNSRALEGLDSYIETIKGGETSVMEVEENGVTFQVPMGGGQKTGWFYDHRRSRARTQAYVQGKRVLDLFSYVGGWGIQAAVAGAREVTCIDRSPAAIEDVDHNAKLNGVEDRVTAEQTDGFEALSALRRDRERFDVVILDPPALIPRKKDLKKGTEAYRRLNQQAMQVLEKDGILITSSCSYHLPWANFSQLLLGSARHLDRHLQGLEKGHQGPDHPIHPAIPETEYLKTLFARVLLT